jgi:hypothetical protein
MLSIGIIEAKNLLAKDANGFSDPYCCVLLVNSNQALIGSHTNDKRIEANRTPNSSPNATPPGSPKPSTCFFLCGFIYLHANECEEYALLSNK